MRKVHGLIVPDHQLAVAGHPHSHLPVQFPWPCSVRETRARMTEDEYWSDVARALGWNTEPDDCDYDGDVPVELLSLSYSPCAICGEYGPCGSDQEGRPWIHVVEESE